MKNILTIFSLIILFTANIFSQNLPPVINFQGVLKDNAGTFYPDGNYQILINIYPAQFAVSSLWNETQTISVEGGIFSVQIGNAEPLNLEFDDAYWVGFSIDGGSELTPRLPLASVPYSFMSMNVMDESITSQKIADGEVVKSLNGLKDNVNLVAGSNVTITPGGNDITISASGGGGGTIGGSGTANYLPLFSDNTTLGNSRLYQTNNRIGLGITAPASVLHLHDVSGLSHLRITSATTGTSENDGFTMSNAGTDQMFFMQRENANINFSISGTPTLIMAPGGLTGIGTINPTTKLHVNSTSSPAFRLSDGTNANGKVLVSDADGNASWQDKSSRYTQSTTPLNNFSANLSSTYASMGNVLTFTKVGDDSKVEVYFNSGVAGGTFASGATGVRFQLRINGGTGQFDNNGVIKGSGSENFLSMMAVFTNLPAGTYTVSVWARTNSGTSTNTLLDPGGWGGKIIVKETY